MDTCTEFIACDYYVFSELRKCKPLYQIGLVFLWETLAGSVVKVDIAKVMMQVHLCFWIIKCMMYICMF